MKEFFENLKQKRLEKRISLEDIQRKSRLSLEYLRAIEEGRIEKLPPGYERIYLRRYAQEIGLDVEEVLRDFDLMSGRFKQPEPLKTLPEEPKISRRKVPRPSIPRELPPKTRSYIERLNLDRIHKIFWISLALATLVGAGYFTYQQYVFEKYNQNMEVREIPITELVDTTRNMAATDTTAQTLPDSANPAAPAGEPLALELRALVRTWIREVRDETDTTDYILQPGIRHSLRAARGVELLLGKADGVEIWLNGRNLGVPGQSNTIALLTITREGITRKELRPAKIENRSPGSDSTRLNISTPGPLN